MEEGEFTYEQAVARLEEITRLLEGRSLTLEESLKIFEEGVSLCRFCLRKLEEAENRIEVILQTLEGRVEINGQGKPRTESFADPDELFSPSSKEEKGNS